MLRLVIISLVSPQFGYYCIYCTNKFCCPTKVFSDLLLLSSRAVKLLAQQGNPPLNKVCETEQNLFGAFSAECLAAFQTMDFTDVATTLHVSILNQRDVCTICSEAGLPSATKYISAAKPKYSQMPPVVTGCCENPVAFLQEMLYRQVCDILILFMNLYVL